ncbi:MAG: 2-hydroxychromene-2-carboxylate isomerase [Cellvibrionales bacterium TMED49]|nr:2-hydroxychromene-2-carboxylate isomerase [Porticoccaceae bacterium]OUU37064.1 MAG: 2-hydroxychromene-2-carboxylate isomerase [Cellvibrionales bacterium TMED49]|tara:strand:+ start:1097 stop:2479 length:1383 start_codon:yes stop_codon:yes gene_type:complete
MSENFKELGGASTKDPTSKQRWRASRFLTKLTSEEELLKIRALEEKKRSKKGSKHVVEYFHFVEDSYSHLSAQVLKKLPERYDVEILCHLVSGPPGDSAPELDMLMKLSRIDAHLVAPEYGLEFPEHPGAPAESLCRFAEEILAAQGHRTFIDCAQDIGHALWAGNEGTLRDLARKYGRVCSNDVKDRIASGNARRSDLKHYLGAMFFYAGEWYWGVDRLYHLEARLAELGLDKRPNKPLLISRPEIEWGPLKDAGTLTLEFFPTMRSPYVAIIYDRTLRLAKETGVRLVLRPVLPMVMRGLKTTHDKGRYIFWDASREARAAAVPFGNIFDSVGKPVRDCHSLFDWACELGRERELFGSFLSCVFARRINTNTQKGMRQVVEMAGLDWKEAKVRIGNLGWEDLLETNRKALYEAGIWGTPAFRLLNKDGEELVSLWGQDRLWLLSRKIQRYLESGKNWL